MSSTRNLRSPRWLCLGLLVACVGLVGHAQQKAVNVSGTWRLQIKTPDWTSRPILTLAQSDARLTGHYSSKNFGEHDIQNGKINGRAFEFSINVNNGRHGYQTVRYKGSLTEKDTLDGTVDSGAWGKGTFTATRSATSK